MKNSLERLLADCKAGQEFTFLYFWGHTPPKDGSLNRSCLSQWWLCPFTIDGITYSCAEQYMMAEKARLFHDDKNLANIMSAKTPKEMKEFGRAVSGFDRVLWERQSYEVVKKGNYAKFSQNPDLWHYLKSTGNCILVEASPVDRVWGIGIGQEHPNAGDPSKWEGANLLGFALTEVRDELLEKEWTL
ncbi:NADAR family protein [Cohnella endophytica]|uniref:NADAR family protein n=1 Tax=Cohnella endophytica TaxID=2419778 RepID=A0A494XLL2_9BACL|nr:NADAR family protein [Cohnella endophytica]RKP51585.1 NADAR family protein [Cohnella endophytica]